MYVAITLPSAFKPLLTSRNSSLSSMEFFSRSESPGLLTITIEDILSFSATINGNTIFINVGVDLGAPPGSLARAGGSYYTRARDGFFEIPKPISSLGIGVDAIPSEIRNSTILTGNNLGMLGNVEQLPNEETVNNFGREHKQFLGLETTKKHIFAQEFLSKNDVESAWKVLLLK